MVLIIRRVQAVAWAQCDDDLISMDDRPAEMALNDLAIGRIVVSLAILRRRLRIHAVVEDAAGKK
jgi:hypothetical protein